MISYEELCQALDLFNNRQKNAAEMTALEQTEDAGDFEQMQPGFLAAEEPAIAASADISPEAMRTVPTAVDVMDDEPVASAPETAEAAGEPLAASEEIPAEEIQTPPSEETHEIDVDDVEIEDK